MTEIFKVLPFFYTPEIPQVLWGLTIIPGALETTEIMVIAAVFGGGGCLLLTIATLLAAIFALLIVREKQAVAQLNQNVPPQIVPEPDMPQEVNHSLEFSTGQREDDDEDDIATEVFVRSESIPPDEIETIDELPGTLLARVKKDT